MTDAPGYDYPFYDVDRQLKLAEARRNRELTEESEMHFANMRKVKDNILKKVVEEVLHVSVKTNMGYLLCYRLRLRVSLKRRSSCPRTW